MMEIPITILSDEKGYFDRECPNENCQFRFKIHMKDWENKITDDEVHCPLCGCVDESDKWWTTEQLESIQELAVNYAESMISKCFEKTFKDLERSTRGNKYVKITYKPGKRITFVNNPIGQSEEWKTDIICEKCETRYSVIGAAYFCPCCGYNSAVNAFYESIDNIEKMLGSIEDMKRLFSQNYGDDKAETMSRSLLENTLGDILSVFQKYASCIYDEITNTASRVNDFQIVEKGSKLFKEATGKGYDEWLSTNELEQMNTLFQRRHLIDHNNGIVDQKYIDKSNDITYVVGQRLVIKIEDAYKFIYLIKKLCTGLQSLRHD